MASQPRSPKASRLTWIIPLALLAGCAPKRDNLVVPESREVQAPGSVVEIARADAALIAAEARAQVWQRSTLEGNTSRLMVGDDRSLPLGDVEVRVLVEGFRARVLVDLLFDNPDDKAYEGRFQIRLPGDASPYFLAFGQSVEAPPAIGSGPPVGTVLGGFDPGQIMAGRAGQWIAPKEARLVQREVAQRAYEGTVHPRLPLLAIGPQLPPRTLVDPALAEWVGAGVFDAKVFPIVPRSGHRVVIGYDMDLDRVGDDLELSLPLPSTAANLRVDVEVRSAGERAPRLSPPATFGERGEDGTLRYRIEDPKGPLHLVLPGQRAPLVVGSDPSGSFFAARLTPDLPSASKPDTRRAVFAIDTSMSAQPEQLATWLDLTSAVLQENRREVREFAVVFFDIEARWWREEFVANTPANVAALLADARSLVPEGASNVGGALDAATRPSWSDLPPEWNIFLLSDGAATWGETDPAALARRLRGRAKSPLFAYQTPGAGANPWLLQQLAESTGGAVFSMSRPSEVRQVARAHRTQPWEIAELTLEGATDLLIDGAPRVLYPGQEVRIVGRGQPGPGAEVVFRVQQGQGRGRRERLVRGPLGNPQSSELAPRMFGEVAVAQLEAIAGGAPPEVDAYARHFRVPGQSCSLLMLESEEDYQRYGIRPEADAEVVRGGSAAQLLEQVRERLPKDASAAFLLWLERLVSRGELVLDSRLAVLLPALPSSLFAPAEQPGKGRGAAPSGQPDGAASDDAAAQMRGLSSRLESRPGDARLAAELAFKALAWDRPSLAAEVLEASRDRVAREANLSLVYALGLAAQGRSAAALVYFELALQRLHDHLGDYGIGYAVFALEYRRELEALAAGDGPLRVFAEQRAAGLGDSSLSRAELGVALLWDTPRTDVDLIVTDPEGRTCDYKACTIANAGVSVDATEGYGPEVFTISGALPGTYTISARYFSGARHRDAEAVQVLASVYRDMTTAEMSLTRHAATLSKVGEEQVLASVRLGPPEEATSSQGPVQGESREVQ